MNKHRRKWEKRKKTHQANTKVVIVANNIHWWMLKMMGESLRGNKICVQSLCISCRCWVITKRKKVTLQRKKNLVGLHLNQVIKVNTTIYKACQQNGALEKNTASFLSYVCQHHWEILFQTCSVVKYYCPRVNFLELIIVLQLSQQLIGEAG